MKQHQRQRPLRLPQTLASLSRFLGAAAGPTALFSLGFGLAGMSSDFREAAVGMRSAASVSMIKLLVQPLLTSLVIVMLGGSLVEIWGVAALVMAAQPVGAGAYVFASQYGCFASQTSLSIVVSMALSLLTIPAIIRLLAVSG